MWSVYWRVKASVDCLAIHSNQFLYHLCLTNVFYAVSIFNCLWKLWNLYIVSRASRWQMSALNGDARGLNPSNGLGRNICQSFWWLRKISHWFYVVSFPLGPKQQIIDRLKVRWHCNITTCCTSAWHWFTAKSCDVNWHFIPDNLGYLHLCTYII